ncbi:MAG: hypothetical protein ABII90_04395 [Bacteroidota bacterium]
MKENRKISIINFKFIILNFQFILFFPLIVISQINTYSPYSRYGIGDLQSCGFAQNMAMGGIAYGLNSPYHINLSNPASYASFELQSFVFATGVSSNIVKISSNDTAQNINNTSLAYLAFGFPVTKWWGCSFGLRPYSTIGYKVSDSGHEAINEIGKPVETGKVNYLYQGSGGLNQFYIGNAFKLKNFSFGFNASYLFGPIENMRIATFDTSNIFDFFIDESTKIGDFYFNYGIQYSFTIDTLFNKELKDRLTITTGVRFDFLTKLNADKDIFSETYYNGIVKDTVDSSVVSGEVTLPGSFGIGIAIKKGERWLFGVDYFQQDWSDFSFFGANDSLTKNMRIALGVQYIPDQASVNKFWKIAQYRVGLHYEETYLLLNGIHLKEYGIGFGVGLPLKRSNTTMNISVELGQRGTTDMNLIKEEFVKVCIGLAFNDKWFIRRKFD